MHYKNYNDLKKKLANKNFDIFINFATFYQNTHKFEDIKRMHDANIYFPNLVLDITKKKLHKFINFGTMMEYSNKNYYSPKNLYAATKKAFEDIILYYQQNFHKLKLYNIKIFETFDLDDKRKKIIPELFKCIKNNKKFKIYFKNLILDVILVSQLNLFIKKIIYNKIKPGTFVLSNKNKLNILSLVKKIKKNNKKFNYNVKKINGNFIFFNKYKNAKTIKFNDNIENYILKNINENC
ncbi:MAG: NAD-dependent epimerase/dehydratase family protein [Opitutae bacterium]